MGSVELHIQLLGEVLAVGAVGLLVPPVSASALVGTIASLVGAAGGVRAVEPLGSAVSEWVCEGILGPAVVPGETVHVEL